MNVFKLKKKDSGNVNTHTYAHYTGDFQVPVKFDGFE